MSAGNKETIVQATGTYIFLQCLFFATTRLFDQIRSRRQANPKSTIAGLANDCIHYVVFIIKSNI